MTAPSLSSPDNGSLVEALAAEYGVALAPEGAMLRGRCPVCRNDTLIVDTGRDYWSCAPCGAGGSPRNLVQHVENVSFAEASKKLGLAVPPPARVPVSEAAPGRAAAQKPADDVVTVIAESAKIFRERTDAGMDPLQAAKGLPTADLRQIDGLPDLQDLVERYDGYGNIPAEAWAEYDAACARWYADRRLGVPR